MKHHDNSAIAVIIGRAGSKGLPGKNWMELPFGGRPTICYSIEHAQGARSVRRIIVTTDGDEIARAARAMGVDVVRRPAELASDHATVDAAVRHAVEQCGQREPANVVVILYANVPIRPPHLIDDAVQLLIESRADSVQSYAPVGKHHPYWMVKIDESGAVSQNIPNRVYRRQDLPPLYLPDGGVIAVTRKSLFTVDPAEPHAFLGTDRRGIVNEAGAVIDIDSMIDAQVAGAMLMQAREGREVSLAAG